MSIETEITRLQNAKTAIKNAIESKGVTVGDGLIDTYAEKINAIPSGGGGDDYYNTFWDIYQNNGDRTNYVSAFRGSGWTNETFKPKYDITPSGGASMSYEMFNSSNIKGDLTEILNECGVQIKWGSKTYFSLEFAYSAFTKIKIDVTPSTYSSTFRDSKNLTDLEIKSNSNTTYTSAFLNCTALVNLIINGYLGKTVSFAQSPLNKTSIVGVFDAMSSTVTGQTVTFNKAAVNAAFGINVDDETTFPEGSEYYELRNSKSNWTVSYA